MTAALQTLAKFKRLAESHKVDEIIAAATSATREAENGGDFIAEVERQTGIRIKVISGTEEARLIHLAAAYGVDVGSSTAGRRRHRRRQRRGHARNRDPPVTLGTELQDRRHPPDRALRQDRPARRHDERRLVKYIDREMGALSRSRSRGAASTASSARPGRSSASGRWR